MVNMQNQDTEFQSKISNQRPFRKNRICFIVYLFFQVRYWNIPMITAGALAGDFGLAKHSVFSTLTRLGSNFNTLVRFFITVLEHYKWQKLNVIYDPFGQTDISSKFCHILANDIHYGFR